MNTVLVKLLILGCSDDGGCPQVTPNCNDNNGRCFHCENSVDCLVHRNRFCRNGRCRRSEMNKQITTVLIEPSCLGCTDDEECQGNQICDDNGRCIAGEMHKLLVITILLNPVFGCSSSPIYKSKCTICSSVSYSVSQFNKSKTR